MLKLVHSLSNGLYQHLMESIDTDDDEVRVPCVSVSVSVSV
jgi:hypothetical protein